jgi:hypothetical protein
MVIDARGRINGETFPDSPLDDRVIFIDQKALASPKVTVEACQPYSKANWEVGHTQKT